MSGLDSQKQTTDSSQKQNTTSDTDYSANTSKTGSTTGVNTIDSTTGATTEAKGALTDLLNKYQGLDTSLTGDQQSALSNLSSAAKGLTNFGGASTGALNKLYNTDVSGQVGLLGGSLGQLQQNIGRTASGEELNPYATPGFGDSLNTLTSDITKNVKNVYNAAGRDPSGAGSFAGSLGRGLTQGLAPVLQSQFNTNKANQLAAAGSLYGAGSGAAKDITSINQTAIDNAAKAIPLASTVNATQLAPAEAQVAAANIAQGQAAKNLEPVAKGIEGVSTGLGTSTAGTTTKDEATTGATSTAGKADTTSEGTASGTSTTTKTPSVLEQINDWAGLGASVAGLAGLSDKRMKHDIRQVGMLNDGQKIYRFRFKGDPKMRIGLLAQQVEEHEPEAVTEVAGVKMVDHKKATDRAARMEG